MQRHRIHLLANRLTASALSPAECSADHRTYDDQYLHGYKEPLIMTGSPDECDTQGCLDGFWGPRSRYSESSAELLYMTSLPLH